MVAQLLHLRLLTLVNAFRGGRRESVGLVAAGCYGIAATAAVAMIIGGLRSVEADLARDLMVVLGCLISAGFVLLPLGFGARDALDPGAFRTLGLPRGRLADALLVAGLISFPIAALAVVGVAHVAAFGRSVGSALLALLAVPLIVAGGTLTLRIMTAVAAQLLRTRRAREVGGLLATVALVAVAPALILFAASHWGYGGLGVLRGFADALSWTPLGSAWAIAGDAAAGQVAPAVAKLLLTLLVVGLLWLVWHRLVARLQASGPTPPPATPITGRLGWFERLSRGPTGAVAARSFVYWASDPRYRTSLAMIPVIPLVTVVPLAVAGVPVEWLMFLPVPVMCLFLGWGMHNDVAFDNSAIWLHLASGVPGRADRIGRLLPGLVLGLPLIALGTWTTYVALGVASAVPALIGMSVCILLTGIGLSSYASARFPYPAVRPGDSPFAQPQSVGTSAGVIQSLLFAAIVALTSPVAVFTTLGFTGSPEWHWAAFAAGLIIGTAVLVAGVIAGARAYDRRSPEILSAAMRN